MLIAVTPFDAGTDLDAVLEIERASFTRPTSRDTLLSEIRNSDVTRIWVARVGDVSVAGFCSCWLVLDELHIHTVAVRPDWRRRGIARVLLVGVLRAASAEGATRATLEVRPSNAAARALYASLGFRERGTRPGYYRGPVEDALILWREGLEASEAV